MRTFIEAFMASQDNVINHLASCIWALWIGVALLCATAVLEGYAESHNTIRKKTVTYITVSVWTVYFIITILLVILFALSVKEAIIV